MYYSLIYIHPDNHNEPVLGLPKNPKKWILIIQLCLTIKEKNFPGKWEIWKNLFSESPEFIAEVTTLIKLDENERS